VAVDRELALAAAVRNTPGIAWQQADLEDGIWPFPGETFRGVVVTNYLHRPCSTCSSPRSNRTAC